MRTVAVALVAILAAGCASVPEPGAPEMPLVPPPTWQAAAEGAVAVDEAWWTQFDDPRLDEFVVRALTESPALEEAEARVRSAEALARIAGADQKPQVSVSQLSQRSNSYLGDSPFTPSTQRADRFGVSLNLSWEIDLWGRIRAGQSAAIADLEIRQAILDGAALSLAAQTTKAYLAAVEAQLQIGVAESNLESAESLSARIQERFERGLRGALDVKLAETEVASARAALLLRERLFAQAIRQLETLAVQYPAGDAVIAASLPVTPEPVAAGIPADVVGRRPDLRAAERFVAASGYRVSEAEASLYPRISLTGSGGLASGDLEDLVSGDFGVWSLAENLVAPIFTGGFLTANVDRAVAGRDEALAAFAGQVLTAFNEVETSLAVERTLMAREESLEILVGETTSTVELSEERYLAGLASILDVLEARRRDFSAKSQLILARLERLNTRVDLITALGGGTTPEKKGS